MIFGQETFGWHEFSISIEKRWKVIKIFLIMEMLLIKKLKKLFWKAFRWFRQNIDAHYKDKKVTYFGIIYQRWEDMKKRQEYLLKSKDLKGLILII